MIIGHYYISERNVFANQKVANKLVGKILYGQNGHL